MGKHSINKRHRIRISDVCGAINKNFNGFKFSKNKERNPGHVNKLPFKNIIPADVFDDSAVSAAAMDITLIHFNSIHENVNPDQLNNSHFNASKPRLCQVILRTWNKQRSDY